MFPLEWFAIIAMEIVSIIEIKICEAARKRKMYITNLFIKMHGANIRGSHVIKAVKDENDGGQEL